MLVVSYADFFANPSRYKDEALPTDGLNMILEYEKARLLA